MINIALRKLKGVLIKIVNLLSRLKDYVDYNGLRLPLPKGRLCTKEFRNNEFYIESAKNEVNKLIKHTGLNEKMTILDIGSGQGRLAIGLLALLPKIHKYYGVDVSSSSIDWCKRNISDLHPNFKFVLTDIYNERYNKFGVSFCKPVQLPFADNSFEVVFLYSVFTHMRSDDIIAYLADIKRVLRPRGKSLFTVFVELECEDEEENPKGYLKEFGEYAAIPLHVVRFKKDYFDSMILSSGLNIDFFEYRAEEVTKQSIYVVQAP